MTKIARNGEVGRDFKEVPAMDQPDGGAIRRIYEKLEAAYPGISSRLLSPSRGKPLDVLIATILSQSTNDTLSSRAFRGLKKAFPDWAGVLSADPEDVEKILAVGGLQHQKTKKIRQVLRKILADFGSISIDGLFDWPSQKAFDYLVSLPGVGPKTAACVIGFGLGKPALPVDTHVLRISRRLGLVPPKASAEKTQVMLESSVSSEIQLPLHIMMIQHGRDTCHSRNPRCSECPLRSECRSADVLGDKN